jgi:cellulose synthase/poly-beta-1,6-N-acetylglucosamine synthase-like glycosyltransferase
MRTLQTIFWVCFGLTFYAYAGYALVIWCASRVFGRKPAPPVVSDAELPPATLLIAAYNEEAVIGDRVANALLSDYPRDKFRIVVASDGSADRTPQIVAGFADRGVRLLDYKARRGKSTVLNSAMAEVDTELVFLSDANTHIDPEAPRKLARWLADSSVTAVCGRLVLTDPATGSNADGMYWKYETFLKKCEGRLGALLGANGAIYAIRRADYVPIPGDTIVDDFVIPLLAKVRRGGRIVYDAEAVAREETAEDVAGEFKRRTRIGAGGFQAAALLWRLLDVRRGWVSFTFLSHKILRWLCPFFMLGMLLASAALAATGSRFFVALFAAQVAWYLAWPLSKYLPARVARLAPLRLANMFTAMNLALLVGFGRWVRGRQKSAWERTARLAERPGAAPVTE